MIVGLAGPMRVGKDSAAEALVRDMGFERVGFTDKLKELALLANPLVTTNVQTVNIGTGAGHLRHVVTGNGSWDQAKDFYPEVRQFLQNLGEGARKIFGDTFWISQALSGIERDIVVPDVRYENELDAIQNIGGMVIRIDRDGYGGAGHPSETEIGFVDDERFDGIVVNDGSVTDLQRVVVERVRAWRLNNEIGGSDDS